MASRNQVPTPGWRKLTESQLLGKLTESQDHAALPESDDDEAFIAKHNNIAESERQRWAGDRTMKKVYAATKGSTTKSASKRARTGKNVSKQVALYPKPMESFILVEEAKKAYLEKYYNDSRANDKHTRDQLRRNLKHFVQPIQAFAAIEQVMQNEMDKIKQFHTSRAPLTLESNGAGPSANGNACTSSKSSQFSFDDGTKFDLESHLPPKRRKRSTSTNFFFRPANQMREILQTSQPEEEKKKPPLDVALRELAMEKIVIQQESFVDKNLALYNAAEDILKQAGWKVPEEKSFVAINTCFQDALESCNGTANGSNQSENQLSECIKLKINPNRYPMVAETFKLGKDYHLDGCDFEQSWIPKMRKAKQAQARKAARINPVDEEQHITSHGFSLPMYAFDSDEEMDVEIGNPLLEDVWSDVRKRWARRRRRKGTDDLDEKIGTQPMPKTLRSAENLQLVHPDDKLIENAPVAELSTTNSTTNVTANGNHYEKPLAAITTSITANGVTNQNSIVEAEVSVDDDDDDDELEELYLSPPEEEVNPNLSTSLSTQTPCNQPLANNLENMQASTTATTNASNGSSAIVEDLNGSLIGHDIGIPGPDTRDETSKEPVIEVVITSPSHQKEEEARRANSRNSIAASGSQATLSATEAQPRQSETVESCKTVEVQGTGDHG